MSSPEKTAAGPGVPDVPDVLRRLKRWIPWSLQERPRRGAAGGAGGRSRPTKVPGRSQLDPDQWETLDGAAARGWPGPGHDGLGLVTTGPIPLREGGPWVLVLDMDACRDPATGELATWAQEVLDHFQTYAEASPSGYGVHAYVATATPPRPVAKVILGGPGEGTHPAKTPEIQVFGASEGGAYVTVTGDRVGPWRAVRSLPDALGWLRDRHGARWADEARDAVLPGGHGDAPTPDEIEARLREDPRLARIMDGDFSEWHGADSSAGFHELARGVLSAARQHGDVAVDFLLERTPWGAGDIESSNADKYTRRDWVEADVARAAAKPLRAAATAFDDGLDVGAWEVPRAVLDARRARPQDAKVKPRRAALSSYTELRKRIASQEFIFFGLLPFRILAQIFGEWGSGKTPFALSMAIHAAIGRDFFGYTSDVTGSVAYIVGEDLAGILDRFQAQCEVLGLDPDSVPVHFSETPARLCDEGNVEEWVAEIRQSAPGAIMVIIDTQDRNFGSGDENSTRDMHAFVDALSTIRDEVQCTVVTVHQPGLVNKDRARGSNVLTCSLDADFDVKKHGLLPIMQPGKTKGWAKPSPLHGQLVPVQVATHEKTGLPITAITLRERPAPELSEDHFVTTHPVSDFMLLVLQAVRDRKKKRAPGTKKIADETGLSRRTVTGLIEDAQARQGWLTAAPGGGVEITDAGRQAAESKEAEQKG